MPVFLSNVLIRPAEKSHVSEAGSDLLFLTKAESVNAAKTQALVSGLRSTPGARGWVTAETLTGRTARDAAQSFNVSANTLHLCANNLSRTPARTPRSLLMATAPHARFVSPSSSIPSLISTVSTESESSDLSDDEDLMPPLDLMISKPG